MNNRGDMRQITYQVKWRSIAVCAFEAAGKRFEAECTADGAERKPAEGSSVIVCGPRGEEEQRMRGELVGGLCKGGGPEQEGL